MLCQFSFQNFKSYKGETTLDFQAASLPEYRETLITVEKAVDLLPLNVIYGSNGGGKSNILQALSALISVVVTPVAQLEKNRQSVILQQKVDIMPYAFDDKSMDEPTIFEVFFRVNNNEYCYYLSTLNNEILVESLHRKSIGGKKTAIIFERDNNEVELGFSINKKSINKDVNPKMPYLSFLAINYDIAEINEAIGWFESCIIRNYANPKVEEQLMIIDDEVAKKNFIRALNDMDIDIVNYSYDEDSKKLYTQRYIGKADYFLDFNYESDGTRKLIAALPVILIALNEGRLVIIDELDAKLHPKLLKYIISLFKDREINKYGAQLLFTSHDMSTMKNTVFRRDEIWFAAQNEKHESEIYSLYDIRREDNERVNNTAAYDKQYLEGRYGADPYLSNMLGGEFR